MADKIYLGYVKSIKETTKLLMESAGVAAQIPSGANVALKPNLVVAKPADSGATTHPEILDGAIEYLFDNGIKDVSIIEGSWVGESTQRAFRAAGYDVVAKRHAISFYDLKTDETRSVDTRIGEMKICRRALEAGYLINMPVLKGHCQTTMTCALKNLKGCLPDAEKRRFHRLSLNKPIAALAAALKVHLTIVDGICGDLSFEEGGNPVYANRMLSGRDMVAIDAFGCELMGIDRSEVEYIGLAEKYGAGTTEAGEIIEIGDARLGGAYPKPTGTVSRLGRGVRQENACSACYGNLMHALYRLDEKGLWQRKPPIAIGQAMKGVPFEGLGVGRCCDMAAVRVNGCPPSAQDILAAIMDNMV
ncbi:MAG: DUF362 domain-containing protein [Clostridia bacterium]|nr:DUF362 domain-containing protein [Clostridia bacterium]